MKRAITLTEVLIAFALTAVLLASLLGSLTRATKMRKHVSVAHAVVTERAALHQRLSHIFARARDIQVDEKGIRMTYDNGYDADPRYRGEQAVFLGYDRGKNGVVLSFDEKRYEDLFPCSSAAWTFFPDEMCRQWIVLTIDGAVRFPFYLSVAEKDFP